MQSMYSAAPADLATRFLDDLYLDMNCDFIKIAQSMPDSSKIRLSL